MQCLAATYGRAAAYLAGGQLASGGWGVRAGQAPENANSTGLVIAGLRAAGRDPDAAPFRTSAPTATATLLSYQESSGAFVYIKEAGKEESRLMATADALVGAAPTAYTGSDLSFNLSAVDLALKLAGGPRTSPHHVMSALFLGRDFMSRRLVLVMLIVLVLCTIFAGTALAQAPTTKQVGLVIAFPDGAEHLEIVTVPTTATTFDVLQKAKITLASADGGFGPSRVRLSTSVGCPATNCFCDAAHYWAYYDLDAATSKWVASAMGVGSVVPANGAVVGFAWSGFDQSYNPTVQPPIYTFAQIVAKTTPPPVSVPEPGTILLLGSGLAGVAAYVRLRKSR